MFSKTTTVVVAVLFAALLAMPETVPAGITIVDNFAPWVSSYKRQNGDGASDNVAVASANPTEYATFNVSAGASVLIVDVAAFVQLAADETLETLSWNGKPLTATTLVATTALTAVTDQFFYIWNPDPGNLTLTINSWNRGSVLHVFTLAGVDTNIAPIIASATANPGANVSNPLTISLPANTPAGGFAAFGQAVRDVGSASSFTATGQVVAQFPNFTTMVKDANPYIGFSSAYVLSLTGGATTVTETMTSSNGAGRHVANVAVFTPAPTGPPPIYWVGGGADGTWQATANWTGGVVPGSTSSTTSTDTAGFNAATGTHMPVVVDSNRNVLGLVFDTASAGAYTIGDAAGNALFLTSGGAIKVNALVANPQVINAPLVLEPISATTAGTYSFTNNATASAGFLTIGGVSGGTTTGGVTLTLNGGNAGNNAITGAITNGGAASVSIVKADAGIWTLGGTSTYSGSTLVSGGTLNVAGTLSNTTPVGISAGVLNLNGTISGAAAVNVTGGTFNINGGTLGNSPAVSVSGGGIFQTNGALTTGNVTINIGSFLATSSAAAASLQNVTVTAGTLTASGPTTVNNLTSAGTTTFSNGLTMGAAGTMTVTAGTTAVSGDLALGSGGLAVSGGTMNANGNITGANATMALTGGTTNTTGTVNVNTLTIKGVMNATGTLTAANVNLTDGGVLKLLTADTAAGLPAFSVGGGVGHSAWLNMSVAQNTKPVITVTSGSALTGNTGTTPADGWVIKGPGNAAGANMILQNGAVYGGTQVPTTDDLGSYVGSPVKVSLAAMGGASGLGNTYIVGDDGNPLTTNDIYSSMTYGLWSRTNVADPVTVTGFLGTLTEGTAGQGLQINMNGQNLPLALTGGVQATYNTTNTATGVQFSGTGKLTVTGAALGGSWTQMTRDGTAWNNDSLALGNAAGVTYIAAGKTVTILNGQMRTGSDTVMAANPGGGKIVVGNGGALLFDNATATNPGMQLTQGNVNVLANGMVAVRNGDRFSKGATWTWAAGSFPSTPNGTVGSGAFTPGSQIALQIDNFNPATSAWPNNVDYILAGQGSSDTWLNGLPLGAGARVVGRTGGDSNIDGGAVAGAGLRAAAGATNGQTIALVSVVDQNNFATRRYLNLYDETDLRTTDGGALNVVAGSDSYVTSIPGSNDNTIVATRYSVPAYGRIQIGRTFLAGDLTVKSGYVNVNIDTTENNGTSTVGMSNYFRVNNIYGQNGYVPADVTTDGTGGNGADLFFRGTTAGALGVAAWNAGGRRSIAGSIYWRGEELWIDQGYTPFVAAAPTATTGFTDMIYVGPTSRLTFNQWMGQNGTFQTMPWFAYDTTAFGRINLQPVTIEGSGGVWLPHSGAFNFKNRNEAGASSAANANYQYFKNVTMQDGAAISVNEDNGAIIWLDLALQGNALTTQRSSQFDLVNVTNASPTNATVTLTVGEPAIPVIPWTTHAIRGQIGGGNGPVVVDVRRGTLQFYDGSSLAANATIRSTGIGTNAAGTENYPDGYIDIYAGWDGTAAKQLSAGTIILSGGQDMRVNTASQAGLGGPANVYHLGTKVLVTNDAIALAGWAATPYNGLIGVNRYTVNVDRAFLYMPNLYVGNGATARIQDTNWGDIFADVHVDSGVGTVNIVNGDSQHFGNFYGPGTVAITATGNQRTQLIGTMYTDVSIGPSAGSAANTDFQLTDQTDINMHLHGTDLGYSQGFRLNGHTLTVLGNTGNAATIAGTGERLVGNTTRPLTNTWQWIDWTDTGTIDYRYGRTGDGNGPRFAIPSAMAGATWGQGMNLIVGTPGMASSDLADGKQIAAAFRVNQANSEIISTFKGELRVAGTGYAWLRTNDGTTADGTVDGRLVADNVVLEGGSKLFLTSGDNVADEASGRLEGDAEIFTNSATRDYIRNWTGPYTLTLSGHIQGANNWCNDIQAIGTVNTQGLAVNMINIAGASRMVRFMSGSQLNSTNFSLTSDNLSGLELQVGSSMNVPGTATFNTGTFVAGAGVPVTMGTAVINGGPTMTINATNPIRIGTAVFNAALPQALDNMDIRMGSATVGAGVALTTAKDLGTTQWDVEGGQMTLNGHAALDRVQRLVLGGGTMNIRLDGSSTVGAPAAVALNRATTLSVDGTGVGGMGKTLTFGHLTLTNGVASVVAGHGYGVAFGDTQVAALEGGSAGVTLSPAGTNAAFGAVSFTGGIQTFMIGGNGSDVRLGALSGAPGAVLDFAGGTLHLAPSSNWSGLAYVDNATDVLAVDADLSGYYRNGLPTVSVTSGTTEVAYEAPAGATHTLAGVQTWSLKLSSSMKGIIGPWGAQMDNPGGRVPDIDGGLGGALILNADVDKDFVQTDGKGGSGTRILRMGSTDTSYNSYAFPTIKATRQGVNFAAPLYVAQMTTLGDCFGSLDARDFTLSGEIRGVSGWGFTQDFSHYLYGALTKVGKETVTLSGTNTFQGNTTIFDGTLVMGNAQAFGDPTTGNVVTVDGYTSTLRLEAPITNFASSAYTLVLNEGATVEVKGEDLDLTLLPQIGPMNTLKLSMHGGTAPASPVLGTTLLNTTELASSYVLGLSGTIAAGQDVQVAAAADKGDTAFQIASGKSLTLSGGFALSGARIWDVSDGGTVAALGDITGAQDLTKTGAGKLILSGAGNQINLLTLGGASPGGIVEITAGAALPTSVIVNAGSLYTADKAEHAFGEVNKAASSGVLALSQSSAADIDLTGSTASLGAYKDVQTYSGTLTAGDKFRFGGGAGTLKVTSTLSAGKDAQFGWASAGGNDPLPMGTTIVAAATNLNGTVDIYQPVQITDAGAFANAAAVNVRAGAMLDLGDLPDPLAFDHSAILGNIRMLGGSLSNNDIGRWGTAGGNGLLATECDALFLPGTPYVLGSNFPGSTTVWSGLTHADGLIKVGTSDIDMWSQGYSGPTIVKAGTLTAESTASFGNSQVIDVWPNGTLTVKDTDTGYLTAKLTLGGTLRSLVTMSLASTNLSDPALVLNGGTPNIYVDKDRKLSVGPISDKPDVNLPSVPVTLIKSGLGTLALTDLNGTSVMAKSMVIRVAEGTLSGVNSATTDSLGNATIELGTGATLQLTGRRLVPDGLNASYYGFNNDALHNLAGAYTTYPDRTFSGAGGLLASALPAANARGLQTLAWNYQDVTFPTHAALLPSLGMSSTVDNGAFRDNYMILWTGQFNASESGKYTFYSYSDDVQSMWVDVNGDGIFQAGLAGTATGDQVGQTNWRIQGTDVAPYTVDSSVTLVGGKTYNVAFTFREGGGGDYSRMRVLTPSAAAAGTLLANAPYIMDAGQTGWWTHQDASGGPVGTSNYGNDVTVTGAATIREVNSGVVDLGALRMQTGAALTLVGGANFTSTTFTGDSPRAVTVNTSTLPTATQGGTASLGALSDGGVATHIIKTGPGTVRMTDLTGSLSSGSVVDITAGRGVVAADSTHGSIGAATLRVAGAQLTVEGSLTAGTAGTAGNGLLARYYLGDFSPDADWSAMTPILVKHDGPIDSAGGFGPWADNFTAWWSGYLYTPPSLLGSIYFEMMTDDEGGLWIDGVKRITTANTTANATVAITQLFTPITLKMHENTGGEQAHLRWNVGAGIVAIPLTNLWDGTMPAADMTANPVQLAGNATLDSTMSVRFGPATVDAGSVVNIAPAASTTYMRFASTTLSGDAQYAVATAAYLGAYTQAPAGSTITKTGAGYLVFDNLAVAPADSLTTVDIRGGWAVNMVNGSTGALRDGTFLVDGGGLVLSSASVAGGTSSAPIHVTALGGTLEARAYGNDAAAGSRVVYGATTITQSGPVSIDAGGRLTAFSQGNYDLKITAPVSGNGDLAITGGNVWTNGPVSVNNLSIQGATVTVNGTAGANSLAVASSRLNVNSRLSVAPTGSATVTDNSIVTVTVPNGLGGLPSLAVTTGPNGRSWLNLTVAQTEMPMVTIGADSVVTGDNTGLEMRGAFHTTAATKLAFQDGAVFGSTASPAVVPTTDDLGFNASGQQLRIRAALIGGSSAEYAKMGDDPAATDDIYTDALFGPWTRSNVLDPASDRAFTGWLTEGSAGQGLLVNMNGETSLAINSTTRLDTTDTALGARFYGKGFLAVNGAPAGSWTQLTRAGGDWSQDSLTLTGAGAVPAGKTVTLTNGRMRTLTDNVLAGGGTLEIGNNGALLLDNVLAVAPGMTLTSGAVRVLAGGMVYVRNFDRFTRGATWDWQDNSILAFRGDTFNPAATTFNWPNDIQFIFDEQGSCDYWPQYFPVAGGAALVGRSGGNSAFDGGSNTTGGGIRAATVAAAGHVATAGETVTIASSNFWSLANGNGTNALVNRRVFYLSDATDLRIAGGEAMNVNIGADGPMTTIVGNLDSTRESRIMSGEVQINRTFLANDIHVKSGLMNVNITTGEHNGTNLDGYLRVGTIYGENGYQAADGYNGGSDLSFNQIASFNKDDAGTAGGQRSIAGNIYWRGEELWVGQNFTSFVAANAATTSNIFTDMIYVGPSSRLTFNQQQGQTGLADMMPWDQTGATMGRINYQKVTLEGSGGVWPAHADVWNFKNRNEAGAAPLAGATYQYFPNLAMQDGAMLSVNEDNGANIWVSLALQGNATTTMRSSQFDLVNVTNARPNGAPVTLTVGELGQANVTTHDVRGQIGGGNGPVVLNLIRGTINFWTGGSLAADATIRSVGAGWNANNTTPDGYIQVYTGRSGTGGLTAGTIVLSGGQDMVVYVNPANNGASNQPYVNTVGTKILATAEAAWANNQGYHGIVQASPYEQDAGNAWPRRGILFLTNAAVGEGAILRLNDQVDLVNNVYAGGTDIVANVSGDGNGSVYTTNNNGQTGVYHIGNITGSGSVTLTGNADLRLIGTVAAGSTVIWDNSSAAAPTLTNEADPALGLNGLSLGFSEGFKLVEGGTLGMKQGLLDIGGNLVSIGGVTRSIGTGSLMTLGIGQITVRDPLYVSGGTDPVDPSITYNDIREFKLSGGTFVLRSTTDTTWTQAVSAVGSGSGTLQVESPDPANITGKVQTLPSLTFRDGTGPSLTLRGVNGFTAAFARTDVLASAGAASLTSQIPNADIGPVTIVAGASLQVGGAGGGSVKTSSVSGPVGAGLRVGPWASGVVTITDTMANFFGDTHTIAGSLNLSGPNVTMGGPLLNDATLRVTAGSTADLSDKVITSTTIGSGSYIPGLLGKYYTHEPRDQYVGPVPAQSEALGVTFFQNASGPNSPYGFMTMPGHEPPNATVQLLASIDFPSTNNNPFASIGINVGNNNYSDQIVAIWQGNITAPQTGLYNLGLGSDDGSIIILDGSMAVNNNHFQGFLTGTPQVWSGDIQLQAGVPHSILVGFYESAGGAGVQAWWRSTGLGLTQQIIPAIAFTYGNIAQGGTIAVDAGGLLKTQGFSEHQNVNVDGALQLTGPGASRSLYGNLTGSLTGTDVQVEFTNKLTVAGAAPSIDLGPAGLLKAGTMNVDAPFAFNANNKASIGTLNVLANRTVAVNSGAAIGATNLAVNGTMTVDSGAATTIGLANISSGGKLSVGGGTNAIAQLNVAQAGTVEFNNAGDQNGMAAIHNEGLLNAKTGVTNLSSTIITGTRNGGSPAPTNGQVLHWSFDDSSNPAVAADSSGNGYNGTIQAAPYVTTGWSGKALSFDGGTNVSKVWNDAAGAALNGLQEITVSVWVKCDTDVLNGTAVNPANGGSTVRDRNIFQTETASVNDEAMAFRYDDFGVNSGNAPQVIKGGVTAGGITSQTESSPNVQTDQWQNIVATWKSIDIGGTGQMQFYINGVPNVPGNAQVGIGGVLSNIQTAGLGWGDKNNWKGLMDDLRVYNRQLSPAEIQILQVQTATFGDIAVGDGASLSIKGMQSIANVAVAGTGKLELKGSGWNDCLTLTLDSLSELKLGSAGLLVRDGTVAAIQAEIDGNIITSDLLAQDINHEWRLAAGMTADGVMVKVTILGDVNMDGTVTLADQTALEDNFGTTTKGWTAGDFDRNGTVDWLDYLTLKQFYGRTFDGTPVVPEPATLGLLAFGLGGLLLKRRNGK